MEAFGLNPVLLIAQLISFGVLFFVLNKFLYKKIRQALAERREQVRNTILSERATEKKLKEIEEERIKLEKKGQAELKTLLSEARKEADKIKKDIVAEADQRRKKLVSEARKEIEQEKQMAQEEIRAEAAGLAKRMAARILSENSTSKSVEGSVEELKRVLH